MSALARALTGSSPSTRLLSRVIAALGPVSRRDLLVRGTVVGSALAVAPRRYVLTPGTAYQSICGPDTTFAAGYSVFCCTVNKGVNACPPGTYTAGWWKAADSSWCCGGYRYIVDCNAKCTSCTSGCSGDHICDSRCWNCSCSAGPSSSCDQRRHCCNAFRYGQCNTQVSCSGGVACRVVSCVAPYKWTSCTTLSLSDNQTSEHSAPCVQGCGPILRKYDGLGSNGSSLGASVGPERSVGDGRGRYVAYQRGSIYWTESTGAQAVVGASLSAWRSLGGTGGGLGYPTADRIVRADGWAQTFERGLICDSVRTHTSAVPGASWTKYLSLGRETGTLGYPTADRVVRADGWAQTFEHGLICDSVRTHTSAVVGASWTTYLSLGRETGTLGYPTADRVVRADGWAQTFEHGLICDSVRTRTQAVAGTTWTTYLSLGRETGTLGYPTGEQRAGGDGRGSGQTFERGQLWARTGGPVCLLTGAVLAKWLSDGAETGRWGYPTSDVTTVDGHERATFEHGTITI